MDTTLKSKHSKRSFKDENGQYPAWMSKRKVAQVKNKKKKVPKKAEGKVLKKKITKKF